MPMPAHIARVYVAGPYTNPDPCINTHETINVANQLLDVGFTPFVPHLSHFWHTVTPKPYEDWLEYDNRWIPACDCMLRLPGASSGADKEETLAKSLGIPVYYSLADLFVAYAEG
jgi:hypothetical protein